MTPRTLPPELLSLLTDLAKGKAPQGTWPAPMLAHRRKLAALGLIRGRVRGTWTLTEAGMRALQHHGK